MRSLSGRGFHVALVDLDFRSKRPLSDLVATHIQLVGVTSSFTWVAAGRMTLATVARKDASNCSRAVFSRSSTASRSAMTLA